MVHIAEMDRPPLMTAHISTTKESTIQIHTDPISTKFISSSPLLGI
jgi:hypothetical protein